MAARKTKDAALTLVTKIAQEQQRKSIFGEENDRWEKAEKAWLITAAEARQRVRVLRDELERYQSLMEAVPFDITTGGNLQPPRCLDTLSIKYTTELVENLDSRINAMFEMIDKYAEQHGCHDNLDFKAKLYEFELWIAETSFKAGVLAGVISAGCPKEQVDRFERGLVVSLTSDNRLVKSSE